MRLQFRPVWRRGTLLIIVGVAALVLTASGAVWLSGLALDSGDALDERGKTKARAEQLQARYPYRSLAERLAYEKPALKAAVKPADPKLNAGAKRALQEMEEQLAVRQRWYPRADALRMLHSKEVEKFIRSEGFGVSRVRQPASPEILELAAAGPIAFAGFREVVSEEASADRVALSPSGQPRTQEEKRLRMPGMFDLEGLHRNGALDFLNPAGFGHVKDREHVAGFQEHHFHAAPIVISARNPKQHVPAPAPEPKERWAVRRLELVSLLKHEAPAVYVSEKLPRMQDLRSDKTPTRPMTGFEQTALKALRAGDDLLADATANQIHLVGAVRAGKQCLDCHQVTRGDLLGAFSYELQRDPPLPAPVAEEKP